MVPADPEESNDAGAKAKVKDRGPLGSKANRVLLIGSTIAAVTALSPGILQMMDKIPLKKLQPTENGGWEGGFAFIPPELLQGFTVLMCGLLLGFTFLNSDWLNKKWGLTRLFVISLAVVVLSFGVFAGLYFVIAEPELASMAKIEAQRAASPDQGAIVRASIAERVKERGGSLLRDLAIGWFYFTFVVGLTQATMLLTLSEYHKQVESAKGKAPRVLR